MKKNIKNWLIGLALSFLFLGMGLMTLTIFAKKMSEDTGQIALFLVAGISTFIGFRAVFKKSIRDYIFDRKNWRTLSDFFVAWWIFILLAKLSQCHCL